MTRRGPVSGGGPSLDRPPSNSHQLEQLRKDPTVVSLASPSEAANGRRPRVVLRVLARLFLVPLVALTVTFLGPNTAQASTTLPPAPTIGRAVKSAGVTAGGCVIRAGMTGPIGMGVCGAIGLGIFAFATHDLWMPWVNNLMGEGTSEKSSDSGACLQGSFKINEGANSVLVTATNNNCWSGDVSAEVEFLDVKDTQGNVCGGPPGGSFYVGRWQTVSWTDVGTCNLAPVASIGSMRLTARYGSSTVSQTTITPGAAPWTAAENTQKTDVVCKNALDGATQNLSKTWTGNPDGWGMPSCEAALGSNWHPVSGTVSVGPSVGNQTPVADFTETSLDKYRDCFDPATGAVQCQVKVFIDGQVCSPDNNLCWDWRQTHEDQLGQVQCRFGAYVIALEDCQGLEHQYRPDSTTQTITKTKVDGSPKVVRPPSAPPDPSETKTEPCAPGETCSPLQPEPESGSCLGSGEGWTFDPIDLVFKPVKCAMIWAFKPQTELSARLQRLKPQFETKIPFSWVSVAGLTAGNLGRECPDWRVKVAYSDTQLLDKNVVCESSFTAAIVDSRGWLAGGVIAAAFWPFLRSLLYAGIPVLKPTPTSGKG